MHPSVARARASQKACGQLYQLCFAGAPPAGQGLYGMGLYGMRDSCTKSLKALPSRRHWIGPSRRHWIRLGRHKVGAGQAQNCRRLWNWTEQAALAARRGRQGHAECPAGWANRGTKWDGMRDQAGYILRPVRDSCLAGFCWSLKASAGRLGRLKNLLNST